MFAAIERAIGDGSSASVSYVDFRLDHHIACKVGVAIAELCARFERDDQLAAELYRLALAAKLLRLHS